MRWWRRAMRRPYGGANWAVETTGRTRRSSEWDLPIEETPSARPQSWNVGVLMDVGFGSDVEALPYIRTTDGFLTAMRDMVMVTRQPEMALERSALTRRN